MNRWLLGGVVLVVLVGGASVLDRVTRERSSSSVAAGLRDDLVSLRAEIDACLSIRDRSEIRFQALARGTERLRQELDSLEALDPRGVPTDAYDAYIGRVEDYNESIPEWERQTGGLRDLASRCNSLVRDHNLRAESLQEFLVNEGIWEEEWLLLGGESSRLP